MPKTINVYTIPNSTVKMHVNTNITFILDYHNYTTGKNKTCCVFVQYNFYYCISSQLDCLFPTHSSYLVAYKNYKVKLVRFFRFMCSGDPITVRENQEVNLNHDT